MKGSFGQRGRHVECHRGMSSLARRRDKPLCSPSPVPFPSQAQLEQQLQLERDACAEELSLRQASERKLAEATHALRVARQAADAAEGARAVAAAVAAKAADELAAAEERLRVANEHNLQVDHAFPLFSYFPTTTWPPLGTSATAGSQARDELTTGAGPVEGWRASPRICGDSPLRVHPSVVSEKIHSRPPLPAGTPRSCLNRRDHRSAPADARRRRRAHRQAQRRQGRPRRRSQGCRGSDRIRSGGGAACG